MRLFLYAINSSLEDIIGTKVFGVNYDCGQTGWNIAWRDPTKWTYTIPNDGYYTIIAFNIGVVSISVNDTLYTDHCIVFHKEYLRANQIVKLIECNGSSGGGGGWAVYRSSI